MSNKEKYIKIFKEVFDVEESVLNENFNYKDIEEWDSLTHLTLISELEAAFDILFETEDILHFGGFTNGLHILSKYGIQF